MIVPYIPKYAKGAVVNSLLQPNNRGRHNKFLANSRDTSIKPEMSSGYPGSLCPPPAFTPLAWENSRHLATPPVVSPRYSHIPRGWGGWEAVNRRGGVFLQWTLIPTNTFFLSTLPLAQKDAIRSYKFWKSWNENYSITGAHYRS